MAIDKVQPLKIEDTTTGGDEVDQFPTGLDPQHDHVELAGVVFDDSTHRDESVRIWRDGNDLKFQDVSNSTPHTLTDLLDPTIVQIIIDQSTPMIIKGVYQWSRVEGGTLIAPSGTSFPTSPVAKEWFWRSDENLLYRRDDSNTSWVALETGGGMVESQHEALATLTHEVDSTSYEEYTYSGADIVSVVIWESLSKVRKIREELYEYSSGHLVSKITSIQYDLLGVEKMRMVEDVTYVLGRLSKVQRTKTGSP